MLKVKAGQLDKLGLLFERYNQSLYRFFYRITKEPQLSEDLVQSVFERILKYRHTYTGSGPFITWMFRIARNAHIDHYRKENRYYEETLPDEDHLPGELPAPIEESDVLIQRKQLLERALEVLSKDKKEIIILSRFEGLSYKEIADILELSESAVKVRMFRAMNELRNTISTLSENHHE